MKKIIEDAVAERIEIEEDDNINIVHWWVRAAELIKKDLDKACKYITNDSTMEELYLLGPCFFAIDGFTNNDFKKLIDTLRNRYSDFTEEDFNNAIFKADILQNMDYKTFLHDLYYYAWSVETKIDPSLTEFKFKV